MRKFQPLLSWDQKFHVRLALNRNRLTSFSVTAGKSFVGYRSQQLLWEYEGEPVSLCTVASPCRVTTNLYIRGKYHVVKKLEWIWSDRKIILRKNI